MKNQTKIIVVLITVIASAFIIIFIYNKDEDLKPDVQIAETTVDPWKIDSLYTTQINILEFILDFNDSTLNNKSGQFPSGHVKYSTLKNYLTLTDDGFIIKFKSNSPITTPSISNGLLIVSGGFSSKNVNAFDPDNGDLIWSLELDDDGPSSPSLNDSIVIINTESCTMFALNIKTGKQLWSSFLGDPLISSPVIDNGIVYTVYPKPTSFNFTVDSIPVDSILRTNSHPLIALDSKNGDILWQTWVDGDVLTTMVSDSSYLYFSTFAGTLFKVKKSNGIIEGALDLKATSFPSLKDDKIFITRRIDDSSGVFESIAIINKEHFGFIREYSITSAPYLDSAIQNYTELKRQSVKLDQGNGFFFPPYTCGWYNAVKTIGMSNVSSMQSYIGSAPILKDSLLYNVMGDKLICSNPKTEEIIWTKLFEGSITKIGGHLATAPIIVNNKLITVTHDGTVLIISPLNGEVLFSKELGKKVRNQPIVYHGTIIVPTTDGELVFIQTEDENLTGWSMFLKNQKHLIN